MADALAMLGAAGLAADSDLDRALTAIHIDHDVLFADTDDPAAPQGQGVTESGGVISPEVARRLCCDGWIQTITEADDGTRTVGIGRRSRVVPRWLRRIVRHRDRACRCCGGPIHHIHHIRHWTLGGTTDQDNLAGLCWGCHHRVHEGGWTITGNPNGALTFTNPFGETVTSLRQPLARKVRRRVATDTGVRLGDEQPAPRNRAPRCAQHDLWAYGAGAGPPPGPHPV
jgi:5-methylcytosine-specific restriction endonuclease McrA